MHFITLICKNLLRRPGRCALTVSGLGVAMAAVVALVGVVRGFEQSMLKMYEAGGIDVIVLRKAGVYRSGLGLNEALGEQIRRLPTVRYVSPVLDETISLHEYDLEFVLLEGMPTDSFLLGNVEILAGRRLRPGDRQAVMLGKTIARSLGKTVGDDLALPDEKTYHVVGVFQASQPMRDSIIIMPLDELQEMMLRRGKVTAFVIRSSEADEASHHRLSQQIRSLAPALDVHPSREFLDSAIEIRIARGMAWLTSAVALVIGIINMLNTMLMAVYERTAEIAVLRAVGWRRRRVMGLFLIESAILGAAASLVGGVAGIALVRVLARFRAVEQIFSAGVAPSVAVEAVVITLLVCLVGGGYPAYRASRLDPVEGLRRQA